MIEQIVNRFRRGVEQLAPLGTPDIFPMLELLESLERLKHIGEGYESDTSTMGVWNDRGSAVLESDGVRWS